MERTKPEPDLVTAAIEKVGGDGPAFLIGDTIWDVKAAAGAGVETIAVLTGGFSEAELREAGAKDVFLGRRSTTIGAGQIRTTQAPSAAPGPGSSRPRARCFHDRLGVDRLVAAIELGDHRLLDLAGVGLASDLLGLAEVARSHSSRSAR